MNSLLREKQNFLQPNVGQYVFYFTAYPISREKNSLEKYVNEFNIEAKTHAANRYLVISISL